MRKYFGFQSLILTIALSIPGVQAQQTEPTNVTGQQGSVSEGLEAPVINAADATPDSRPLSGAEEITVGSRHAAHNYFLPSFQVTTYGDSNQSISPQGTHGLETAGSLVGQLALQRVGKTSMFTMDYRGGGLVYSRNSDFNGTLHDFGFTESLKGRRWGFMLGDRMSYLPESPFGFYGFGGGGLGQVGGPGTNLGQLNPIFIPNQSILSGRGSRVSNTTVAQVEYDPSARSQVTATASYGVLRFQEAGPIDSDHRIYTAGYNYMVTRRDTVAVSYGLSQLRFKGVTTGIDTHVFQLSYGRRVTGRLAFELAGGPQLNLFRSSTTTSDRSYSWNGHSSLHYRLSRTDLGVSYSHYTSGGSGLLYGAETDQVSGSVGMKFTRNWAGSITPGYAHNKNLRQTTAGSESVRFDSAYAGLGIHRALGRYMDMSFNYTLQDQRSSSMAFAGVSGGNGLVRHVLGLGFNWHTRPIGID